jgi:hypothetical protein
MKVTIDGRLREDLSFGQDQTLEQALLEINQLLLVDEKRIISEIKVDETVPDLDMSLTPDKVSVEDILAVSFQTQDIGHALLVSIEAAETRLVVFKDNLDAIVNHIISDEIDQGMQALKTGIESMIFFFDALHQSTLASLVDMQEIPLDAGTLNDYITKLNEMLKELVSAMNNSDYTLINDYLEYEIEPALEKIIGVVPEIKARLRGE